MEIRELIGLWEAGEANPSQEAEIRAYFRSEPEIPEDLQLYALMFAGLEEMAEDSMPAALNMKSSASRIRRWSFSLSMVAVAIALFVQYGREPYCYVNGKAVRNMEEAVAAVAPLQDLSMLGSSFDYVLELLEQNN